MSEIFTSPTLTVTDDEDGKFSVTISDKSSADLNSATVRLSTAVFQNLSWALYSFDCKKKHRLRKHRRKLR